MQDKKQVVKRIEKIGEILEECLDVSFDYPAGYKPDVIPEAWITGHANAASEIIKLMGKGMEKLHLMVKALEASERGFAEYYLEEGDKEAVRDCTMKANGMGKILDVMAEYFGCGEEDIDNGRGENDEGCRTCGTEEGSKEVSPD